MWINQLVKSSHKIPEDQSSHEQVADIKELGKVDSIQAGGSPHYQKKTDRFIKTIFMYIYAKRG
jgi:hypothetical protein